LPGYETIYQKYHKRGFEIIAIGTDTKVEAAKKFTHGLRLSFPVVADTEQKFVSLVRPSTMPTAYLVGRDGKVISVHLGFHGDKSLRDLSEAIESALK
jgi:peroxiredoxin